MLLTRRHQHGWIVPDVKAMLPLLGTRAALDNSATIEILDWQATPFEDSVVEMAQAIQR